MRVIIAIAFVFILGSMLKGQQVRLILQGTRPDSSFYDIEKIGANEFWLGGEYGILKRIDSLGNLFPINLPNRGRDIIKIKKVGDFVYLLTTNAVIYRYDLAQKSFLVKEFPDFRNKCFYDFVVRQDGTLLVCGGTTGIAEGKPKIPRGFIAMLSPDLSEINVLWKSARKFVWSLLVQEDQSVLAVTFNGLNSTIITSKDLLTWKKKTKIKGLVHSLHSIDDELWYSGARSVLFKKKGILGRIGEIKNKIKGTGCIWRLKKINEEIIGVTYSGELLKLDKKARAERINVPKYFSLYDVEQLTNSKVLVVGRGKTAYIVDFSK